MLRKLNSVPTFWKSLPRAAIPSSVVATDKAVPRLRKLLCSSTEMEPPAPSMERPVRVHSMMLLVAVRVVPPPSNQMPMPHEASPNRPCCEPEMRLAVKVSWPSGRATEEIARSSTPLAPPTTVDQKIELETVWPVGPPPVRNCRVGLDGPPPVVVESLRKRIPVRMTLSSAVTLAWPTMVVSPTPPAASRPVTALVRAPRIRTPTLMIRSSS